MDSHQRISIANELHSYIDQLRQLKDNYIGAIDQGQAIISQISTIEDGPFDTEQHFNEFILGDTVKPAPDFLRRYAKHTLLDNHDIAFTHPGFCPIVDGARVTAILDWEYAGWYPEYWEYIQTLRQVRPMPDWLDSLPMILPPRFEREYIGRSFLSHIMRH